MGKNRKTRQRCRGEDDASTRKDTDDGTNKNPLYQQQQKFLTSLTTEESDDFFSNNLDPERRAEIWMRQADVGEDLINSFSWATPDEQSLRILKHFSPIIEIGCGANAYWSRLMSNAGIDVVAYDVDPQAGGTFDSSNGKKKKRKQSSAFDFVIQKGGPEVLKTESGRTLFLCYPDEDDQVEVETSESSEPLSMGAACLEFYTGEYVIHVGEIFGDTLSLDQAPWGRSSSPEFQCHLASRYHCILKSGLSNYLHVRDTISVWKRTPSCPIVFGAEGNNDEDEEVEYRYIPVKERLPVDVAAPCVAYLLRGGRGRDGSRNSQAVTIVSRNDKQTRSVPVDRQSTDISEVPCPNKPLEVSSCNYTCPW